ncbi:hypothetical protein P153DRAFT_363080 [Dothidotthia symphoricarpi CBS 119687]|uniref:Heterokaryon incompatibility domain-containing protein n=1 Tax=Dothidotthia symphoricarpi CBS 119687 TaxID=1392245 RepID=A0A6A6AQ77_9PLEO|nr:uncharacterized protein P153DRAFT_363080 [Dothidotthia symphoricarpi CBS 119687]KAF2134079.1 hypothetical protein P153DRAFT_363080 [Dothidotthia symphoricarpi CBS 119687]
MSHSLDTDLAGLRLDVTDAYDDPIGAGGHDSNVNSAPSYYGSLDVSTQQIRLLHLQPGKDDEPIHCYLSVASLDQDIEYEALSYVWGTLVDSDLIQCNMQSTCVGRNLFLALKSLRCDDDSERVLWIDALCINQADLKERSSQVAIMAEIYQRAARGIAYLGECWDGCEDAFEAIRELGKMRHLFSHGIPDKNGSPRVKGVGLESPELLNNVLRFLETPWISRLWTLQEFLLPQKMIFYYGRMSVSKKTIFVLAHMSARAVNSCCMADGTHDGNRSSRYRIAIARWKAFKVRSNRVVPLEERASHLRLLEWYRYRDAVDPRDKVFGLLGLCGEKWARVNPPDYSMTAEEVFTRAALTDAQILKRLDFLSFRNAESMPSLPSWVPDWSSRTQEGSEERYRRVSNLSYQACGPYGTYTVRSSNGPYGVELAVIGHVVGTIVERSSPIDKAACLSDSEHFRKAFREIRTITQAETNGKDLYRLSYRPVEEEYLSSLVCGMRVRDFDSDFEQGQTPANIWQRTKDLFEAWEASYCVNLSIDFPTGLPVSKLNDVFVQNILTRCFVRLDLDCFGWAPSNAHSGDLVVVLHGGRVPYVLRPIGNDYYTFVGDAYIHGMMKGEIFQAIEDLTESIESIVEEFILV